MSGFFGSFGFLCLGRVLSLGLGMCHGLGLGLDFVLVLELVSVSNNMSDVLSNG